MTHSPALQSIFDAPIPAVHNAQLRHEDRKTWAAEVRRLLKELHVAGVSVTTPSYSQASTIHIRVPSTGFDADHEAIHARIDEQERNSGSWLGYGHFCPLCKEHWEAHQLIEKIILAAFPDLDDRSDSQSDHFDDCLSVS